MKICEKTVTADTSLSPNKLRMRLGSGDSPVRCVMKRHTMELAMVSTFDPRCRPFDFRKRPFERQENFTVAFVVPTGVGAEQGGHAGDATPALKVVAEVADEVLTHPNVVNASDLLDLPPNVLYVEGSILSRVLMGTAGLLKTRSNRILVLVGDHEDQRFVHSAWNAANAARAVFGANIVGIERIPGLKLQVAMAASGRASGVVTLDDLSLPPYSYDAIAVTSVIEVDPGLRDEYFKGKSAVNPWGGVEAMFTHWLSTITDLPTAHAPMPETYEIEELDYGIVDPRIAAEHISMTYFESVLKGLMRAPRVTFPSPHQCDIDARDINALVIPDGCWGLASYAARQQGIPIIAVGSDIAADCYTGFDNFTWSREGLIYVQSYAEAAGILAALKAGVTINSIRRPLTVENPWRPHD